MIIDGKAIAKDIEAKVARALLSFARVPTLAIVVVGDDPVIASFVRIKKRMAERLKIPVVERSFDNAISGEHLRAEIEKLGKDSAVDGIIIQLPLPEHIDTQAMLDAVPTEKDIDVLARESVAKFAQGKAKVLPPVAGAIQEILERENVSVAGAEAIVLGHGRLVGVPASILLRHNGAHVTVVDKEIPDLAMHVRESSIVVCGVGKASLVTPEMLAPNAIVLDAGTSEEGGRVVGDADPRCAEVASVFTPVPGGIGPITVAMIFKNLCILARA